MKTRLLVLATTLGLWSTPLGANSAATPPQPNTLRAWDTYIARTEARVEAELASADGFLVSDFTAERAAVRAAIENGDIPIRKLSTLDAAGRRLPVPGGTIAHWRGAVFLSGVTLETLLHRLQHPDERGPFPADVVSLRVLDRAADRLTLAMRVTRTKLVTATYDTEHVARYRRFGSQRAVSTSVSTKIAEVSGAGTSAERVMREGEGRGFLWRMNSYWRYDSAPGGVIVELESITLSRDIPAGLAFVVEPVVDRIARESVTRTLESVRRLYSAAASPSLLRAQDPS